MHRRITVGGRSSGLRSSIVAHATPDKYDYDLVIIGCGVGGHGAALHAVEQVGAEGLIDNVSPEPFGHAMPSGMTLDSGPESGRHRGA